MPGIGAYFDPIPNKYQYRDWICYIVGRMIINEKNWNQREFSQVGCPDWSQNSKF
jgi:arginine deiminase